MTKRDRGTIPTAINPHAFYRVDDIACILNVSRAIVYRLKHRGVLPPWENPFGMTKLAGYTGQTLIDITERLFHDCKNSGRSRPRLGDIPAFGRN